SDLTRSVFPSPAHLRRSVNRYLLPQRIAGGQKRTCIGISGCFDPAWLYHRGPEQQCGQRDESAEDERTVHLVTNDGLIDGGYDRSCQRDERDDDPKATQAEHITTEAIADILLEKLGRTGEYGADRIIPEAGPEVRRLSAGGRWIRTIGPASHTHRFGPLLVGPVTVPFAKRK